jgi:hypothetical protein
MRKLKNIGALFVIIAVPTGASAEQFNEWKCFSSLAELFDSSFDDGEHRINNVSIVELDDFISGAKTIVLSASASNRGKHPAPLSLEAIATGTTLDTPLFSLSAMPPFGAVQPMKTEEIDGKILALGTDFADTKKACIRASVSKSD